MLIFEQKFLVNFRNVREKDGPMKAGGIYKKEGKFVCYRMYRGKIRMD